MSTASKGAQLLSIQQYLMLKREWLLSTSKCPSVEEYHVLYAISLTTFIIFISNTWTLRIYCTEQCVPSVR